MSTLIQASDTHKHHKLQNHKQYSASPKLEQSTTMVISPNTSIQFKNKTSSLSSKIKSQCRFHNHNNYPASQQLKFRPEIHPLPFSIFPRQWEQGLMSRKEQWQQLTKDTRIRNLQRTEQKLREEEGRLQQITFSPLISRFQQSQEGEKQNIFSRLYQQAGLRRVEQLQKQRETIQQQQRQALNNKGLPKSADRFSMLNGQKFDLNPLYLRLEKVIQQKKHNRKMVAYREMVDYPFRPKIDSKSVKIVSKKEQIANVVDRLIEDYRSKQHKMSKLRQKYDGELQKELTFKPVINNFMPAHPPDHQLSKQLLHGQEFSYQPQINKLSAIMTQQRQYETEEQRLFRQHNAPAIRRNEKLNMIEAQVYSECVFNPQINQISRNMLGCGHKHHICPKPQPVTPTHHPKINSASHCMTQSKRTKSLEVIKQKVKQKAQVYTKQIQYRQMKECSFRPKILNNVQERVTNSKDVSLTQVAGFKQYYEQVEKAQQKERRRKEIEDKLFNLEKNYDQRMLKAAKKGGPEVRAFRQQ